MKVGVQFYTIREFCKTLDDFSESLKKVADMGFSTVQISGTCPYEAQWLADELKKNGLHIGLTHNSFDSIVNDTDKLIANHKIFGCDCIGLGAMGGESKLEYYEKEFKQAMKPVTQKIADAGLQFMYHNHSWEYDEKYEDGTPLMHRMAEEFTAREMGFTLDTYWVKFGGGEILDEIKYLKGRLPVVHFKDMFIDESGEKKMSWVGGGNVFNFEKIIAEFEAAGSKYAYIEQDRCYGEDPFECLRKSYEYLKSLGLN
ncbi:MAG: sugar phosphate isomerase/epimerase [Ruminococcaceae bacterium]|nr:sugar phosphate isomerase/epimerase [Oscillospiraceae bacterium]